MAEEPADPQQQPQPTPQQQPPAVPSEPVHDSLADPRQRREDERDKQLHKDETGVAVTAATGMGCLALATLPWSIFGLVFLILLVMWALHGCWK